MGDYGKHSVGRVVHFLLQTEHHSPIAPVLHYYGYREWELDSGKYIIGIKNISYKIYVVYSVVLIACGGDKTSVHQQGCVCEYV